MDRDLELAPFLLAYRHPLLLTALYHPYAALLASRDLCECFDLINPLATYHITCNDSVSHDFVYHE